MIAWCTAPAWALPLKGVVVSTFSSFVKAVSKRYPKVDYSIRMAGFIACFLLIARAVQGETHWAFGVLGGVIVTLQLLMYFFWRDDRNQPGIN